MNNYNNIAVVWQISALHLNSKTLINGVILKDTPFAYKKKIGVFKNLIYVIKTYFISVYAHKEIFIITDDSTLHTKTDKQGSFTIVLDHLLQGSLIIKTSKNDFPLRIVQNYPVIFKKKESPFGVISDIDDTIIVSYSTSFIKRIKALAFSLPQKRKVVNFTQNLLSEFQKHGTDFLYISKSESNLFALLTTFIKHNKLPVGNLILTHYLTFSQLLMSKKGLNYKLNKIYFILKNTGTKQFVLFGDDSQKDMEVYSEIAEEFPDRILKIYIRQTKRKVLSYQKKMHKRLQLTRIPVVYFNDHTQMDFQNEFNKLTSKNT